MVFWPYVRVSGTHSWFRPVSCVPSFSVFLFVFKRFRKCLPTHRGTETLGKIRAMRFTEHFLFLSFRNVRGETSERRQRTADGGITEKSMSVNRWRKQAPGKQHRRSSREIQAYKLKKYQTKRGQTLRRKLCLTETEIPENIGPNLG